MELRQTVKRDIIDRLDTTHFTSEDFIVTFGSVGIKGVGDICVSFSSRLALEKSRGHDYMDIGATIPRKESVESSQEQRPRVTLGRLQGCKW